MSIGVKGGERPGLVLTVGVMLSTLGVVSVALLCCGVPVLLVAAGVLGAAGPAIGNPLMIAAAGVVAAGLPLWLLRRRSNHSVMTGSDCCSLGFDQGPARRSDAPLETVTSSASRQGSGSDTRPAAYETGIRA